MQGFWLVALCRGFRYFSCSGLSEGLGHFHGYPCILTSLLGLNLRIYSGFESAGFDNQLSLT